ncbi:hypothetical protein [Sulfitobacter sp. JB4-11]|uniref:hypothetical protein n=1 Tax=Sulfitobacter rhodophyticola TaxID=3238304 RepID=UPI0035158CE9
MDGAKIRVKVGSMEIEYEGDPAFLDGGIEALLVAMGDLVARSPEEAAPQTVAKSEKEDVGAPNSGNENLSLSTNTIAAHLNSNSGADLVICAIAQLELVQGNASSTRSEILAEMKNATTYYKETYSNNLTASFGTLVKNKRINQGAKDTYSLSATERKQLEAKVAGIG